MEVNDYIRLVQKWWWLIVLVALFTGSLNFVLTRDQVDLYQTHVTVAVGGFIDSPDPSASQISTSFELANTYAQIIRKNYNIFEGTVAELDLSLTPDEMRELVTVAILEQTSLLEISVVYTDPILVTDIANELVRQLIINSPTNLTPEQQTQIDLANDQIASLTNQLENSREQLQLINARLETIVDGQEQQTLFDQRNTLIDQINQASSNIAQFNTTITRLQQRSNSIDIIAQARIPNEPLPTKHGSLHDCCCFYWSSLCFWRGAGN